MINLPLTKRIPGIELEVGQLCFEKRNAGDVVIRDVHPLDFGILKEIDSPIWRRIQNPQATITPYDHAELAEMVWLFTTPLEMVLTAWQQGRLHFRQLAQRTVTITDAAAAKVAVDIIVAKIVEFANKNA